MVNKWQAMHDFHVKTNILDHNIMLFQSFHHFSIIPLDYKSFLNSKDCLVN